MARFERLEFDSHESSSQRAVERTQHVQDEAHWMRQANAERRVGHYENALRYYSRALEEDKSLVPGWLGQVQMLVMLDEFPEADMWGSKALEIFPGNGELLAGRGQALCRQKNLKQAYTMCDGAMRQSGQSAYRWLVRGEILLASKQATARHCFDKAVQLDADWLVSLEIALVHLYYQTPSKALNHAHRAVEKAPDCQYTWYIQGTCQSALGLSRQARLSFEQCLELFPGHVDAERELRECKNTGRTLARSIRRFLGRA